jgi:hypothetical protein
MLEQKRTSLPQVNISRITTNQEKKAFNNAPTFSNEL